MTFVSHEIETHDFKDYGDGTCAYPYGQTRCGYPNQHVIHGYNALPADWFTDSSLETWFPLTAEELARIRDENAVLRTALQEAAQSLRTIAVQAGKDEFLTSIDQIRGYANSRANVAEAH